MRSRLHTNARWYKQTILQQSRPTLSYGVYSPFIVRKMNKKVVTIPRAVACQRLLASRRLSQQHHRQRLLLRHPNFRSLVAPSHPDTARSLSVGHNASTTVFQYRVGLFYFQKRSGSEYASDELSRPTTESMLVVKGNPDRRQDSPDRPIDS